MYTPALARIEMYVYRSVLVCYVLWFFLGLFGAHRFYCYQYDIGILYALSFGLFVVGWLSDLFIVPLLVKETNRVLLFLNNRDAAFVAEFGQANIALGEDRVAALPIVEQVRPTDNDVCLRYE